MNMVKGVIAALVVATATIALGHYIGYDTKFLAGWWSCMAWTFFFKD